jgi:Family of unknown function (DUF6220)
VTTNSDSTGAAANAGASSAGGLRGVGFAAYRWLLRIFLLLGVVQFFLAGLGVFDLHGQKLGASDEHAFDSHRLLGFILAALTILILVAALLARMGTRVVVFCVVLLLLSGVVQSVLADLGSDTAFFGGLHALDGLAILGLAGFLHASSGRP